MRRRGTAGLSLWQHTQLRLGGAAVSRLPETASSSIEEAHPAHLNAFLQTKQERYQKRHGCLPKHPKQWRSSYLGPIHRLLRLAQAQWPPPEPHANECERFQREICEGYGRWLTEVQGLSQETLKKNGAAARLFLRWLGERAARESLGSLSVTDIDEYLEWRLPGLRRATRYGVSDCLRSLLRYLKFAGLHSGDLSFAVSGPVRYQLKRYLGPLPNSKSSNYWK